MKPFRAFGTIKLIFAAAFAMLAFTKMSRAAPIVGTEDSSAPKGTTILLIRHAEKPDAGPGLSPEGEKHALAYVPFFSAYQLGSRHLTVDALFAAADSDGSARPRLTLTPLSQALKRPINTDFIGKKYDDLAHTLLTKDFSGKTVVICWKHGEIVQLAAALGVKPASLPAKAQWPLTWPEDQFGWVLQIVYDDSGNVDLANTLCITQPALTTASKR
jgi:hypothetical protein